MAAQQFTIDYSPTNEGLKKDVVVSTSIAEPGANEIYVAFGDGVGQHRMNEIRNGLKWLDAGISERNLLDDAFNGVALVTAADINSLTASNRRTSSSTTASSVAADDIVIGMGATVTANGQVGMQREAVNTLINAVQEWLGVNG